jgi:hypothetical protein
MQRLRRLPIVLLVAVLAACQGDAVTACCDAGPTGVRIVNAFTIPLDVLLDGSVAIAALAPGTLGTAQVSSGNHALVLRPAGAGSPLSQSITAATGAISTIAAVRAPGGAIATAILDDTNSVVPNGATKVRVLHLAPGAGTLQVYRTQPDFQTPISWQFPFNYQADPTGISAPFYQSTVGTWDVRVWDTPADATGWANTSIKVLIPLASGEKKTVIILDKPGGGVRIELL